MKNQEQGRHSDKKWTKYVQKKALFSNYLNQQTGMREHLGLNGQCTQTKSSSLFIRFANVVCRAHFTYVVSEMFFRPGYRVT